MTIEFNSGVLGNFFFFFFSRFYCKASVNMWGCFNKS